MLFLDTSSHISRHVREAGLELISCFSLLKRCNLLPPSIYEASLPLILSAISRGLKDNWSQVL